MARIARDQPRHGASHAEVERTIKTLTDAGYTEAPRMPMRWNPTMPMRYVQGVAESTLTRQEMLDAMPPQARERKLESLATFGLPLDEHDRQPVQLAMLAPRDEYADLDFWVASEYASGRIAPGYALISVRDRGGRPRIGTAVTLVIPDDVLGAVDRACRGEGVSRAEWVRVAIMQRLDAATAPF